tara:strand:- start:6530 stop:7480 length:951 start_codon:yes stop_codon:yes gene_type:complete
MNILITGGCGYIGTLLTDKLLKMKHSVTVIDNQLFGNFLKKNRNLSVHKKNILEINNINIKKRVDIIIHLSSIANDPMADLSPNLSWETSSLGTLELIKFSKKKKVKRIIYASSGSVYGIKKELKVHENLDLHPISLYNKVKMVTERILLSHKNEFEIFIIRPATVCGFSPRMRLDLTVNALTFSALNKKKITVYGGKQIRPNIHIEDMVDLYIFLMKTNKKNCGIYNAGFENKSINQIASLVKKKIPSKVIVIKSKNDPRSYRLSSQKLLKIGFKPKKGIIDAIKELKLLYLMKKLKNKPNYHSVLWLKKKINDA